MSHPVLKTPHWRKVKVAAFIVFGSSAFIPLGHSVRRYGFDFMLQYAGMKWYLLELSFYGTGVLFYGVGSHTPNSVLELANDQTQFRIPERLAPGRFDIWGSSHQFFHILILCAMYTHVIALQQGFETAHTLDVCQTVLPDAADLGASSQAGISSFDDMGMESYRRLDY
jgi:adiponectin receptor